ncbi:MAG: hypothetical protein IJ941_02020, partial [Clostridia bacterium]|nr:hypothetical protein [Clostridia bacterium]
IEDILVSLCDLGARRAVLTGVGFTDDTLGCYGYELSRICSGFCYVDAVIAQSGIIMENTIKRPVEAKFKKKYATNYSLNLCLTNSWVYNISSQNIPLRDKF